LNDQPHLPNGVEWVGPESYFFGISGLIHAIRLPKSADLARPAPVVVMVHGWGGDESSMWLFKQAVPAEAAIIAPRGPLALAEGGQAWYYRDPASRRPDLTGQAKGIGQLEHFVSSLPDLYPIDPARLVLVGFSQGAAVCNGLALSRPNLLIGLASLAGFVPELAEAEGPAGGVERLSIFISHGRDDEVVPLAAAWRSRDLYQAARAEVTYHEAAVGHKVNSQGLKDLRGWLKRILRG
jgi:phospholipase/carboxylesterase